MSTVKNNQENNESNFKCMECSVQFNSEKGLTLHLSKIHNIKKEYRCKVCLYLFSGRTSYSFHKQKGNCIKKDISIDNEASSYNLIKNKKQLELKQINEKEIKEEIKLEYKEREEELKQELRSKEKKYEDQLKERELQLKEEFKIREDQLREDIKEKEEKWEKERQKYIEYMQCNQINKGTIINTNINQTKNSYQQMIIEKASLLEPITCEKIRQVTENMVSDFITQNRLISSNKEVAEHLFRRLPKNTFYKLDAARDKNIYVDGDINKIITDIQGLLFSEKVKTSIIDVENDNNAFAPYNDHIVELRDKNKIDALDAQKTLEVSCRLENPNYDEIFFDIGQFMSKIVPLNPIEYNPNQDLNKINQLTSNELTSNELISNDLISNENIIKFNDKEHKFTNFPIFFRYFIHNLIIDLRLLYTLSTKSFGNWIFQCCKQFQDSPLYMNKNITNSYYLSISKYKQSIYLRLDSSLIVECSILEFIKMCHDCIVTIDIDILVGSWKELKTKTQSQTTNLIYFWLLNEEANFQEIIKKQSQIYPNKTEQDYINEFNNYIQSCISSFYNSF